MHQRPFLRYLLVATACLLLAGHASKLVGQCTDADADGFYRESDCGTAADCNDATPATYPGAAEICDGYDSDCNGAIDDDPACEPACGFPVIRPPTPVSSEPDALTPRLVWNGAEYATVWGDSRSGDFALYFARLDSAGHKIGDDVRLTQAVGEPNNPAMVWTGTEYGVAWEDWVGPVGIIWFARLDASGSPIGAPLQLTSGLEDAYEPSLVWTGAEYAVAWDELDEDSESFPVYVRRLGATGDAGGDGVQVSDAAASSYMPSLVWTGSGYAVAWADSRDDGGVYFARLDAEGDPLGGESRVVHAPSSYVGVASLVWTGVEYGLAWDEYADGSEIFFERLDASGVVVGEAVQVSECAPSRCLGPDLAWSGVEYGLAWVTSFDGEGTEFAHLDVAGTRIGEPVTLVREVYWLGSEASLAWTGSSYGLAWVEWINGNAERLVNFSRIDCDCSDGDGDGFGYCEECDDGDGTVYPGASPLCDGLNNDCDDPGWPALPTDEVDDDQDGFSECAGDCDDASPSTFPGASQLCDGLNNDCDDPGWPAVPAGEIDGDLDGFAECGGDCDDSSPSTYPGAPQLCDGLNNDCDDPGWPAVSPLEADEDVDGFRICAGDCDDSSQAFHPGAPDVCGDGIDNDCDGVDEHDDDLDGYAECDGDCNDGDASVNPAAVEACNAVDDDCNGILDDGCDTSCEAAGIFPSRPVTDWNDRTSNVSPAFTWNGAGYGATWIRDLRLAFARLDEEGVVIPPIWTSSLRTVDDAPDTVWAGDQYGVAWVDSRDGSPEVYFARFAPDGTPIGEARLTYATSSKSGVSLVWTGSEFAVVWADNRDVSTETYFTRVSASGTPIGGEVRVTPDDGISSSRALLSWNGSGFGVAWREWGTCLAFARLDAAGTPIGEGECVAGGTLAPSSLVWTGTDYAIVWDDDTDGDPGREIWLARIDAVGIPIGDHLRLSEDPASQVAPSLAWSGSEFGAVWTSATASSSGDRKLYFARVNADGVKLAEISRLTVAYVPKITWTGARIGVIHRANNNYLVAGIAFAPIGCACYDEDEDGFSNCGDDCDDADPGVHPGAPQACDGINNDCNDPAWPMVPATEVDDDLDGYAECTGDCDDASAGTYPGAPQLCNGANDDCADPSWPAVPPTEVDADGDGFPTCAGDCDDTTDSTYPGAPQLCNGVNDDCSDVGWPAVPPNEVDADGDGYRGCAGDCADDDAAVNPAALEVCNGMDDDCNGLVDEDEEGEDTDADSVPNLCDNCRETPNPTQADDDGDTVGNDCDNCPLDANAGQADLDDDSEGDRCDVDDGILTLFFGTATRLDWDPEVGLDEWNCYRGDLAVLRATGEYTQTPGTNPLANRVCGLVTAGMDDAELPSPSEVAFYLVTGMAGLTEISLGYDSAGNERPNDAACP